MLKRWVDALREKTRFRLKEETRQREKGAKRAQAITYEKQNIEDQLSRLKCELEMTAVQYTDMSMNATNQ